MRIRLGQLGDSSGRWADPIAKVGHAGFSFENSDPLQLPLFDAEVLEQPPPIAHQDRDQVDLELVEESSGEGALRDARPVDEHVLVTRRMLASRTATSSSLT